MGQAFVWPGERNRHSPRQRRGARSLVRVTVSGSQSGQTSTSQHGHRLPGVSGFADGPPWAPARTVKRRTVATCLATALVTGSEAAKVAVV